MIETLAGVGATAFVGALGFLVHLGTRVSVLESKVALFEKWLEKIEGKLDNALQQ